eukprot:3940358-Rhodomonas_salina.1
MPGKPLYLPTRVQCDDSGTDPVYIVISRHACYICDARYRPSVGWHLCLRSATPVYGATRDYPCEECRIYYNNWDYLLSVYSCPVSVPMLCAMSGTDLAQGPYQPLSAYACSMRCPILI